MEGTAAGQLASPVEIRVAAAPPEPEKEGRDDPEEEDDDDDDDDEEAGSRRLLRLRARLSPAPLGSGSCSEDDSGRGFAGGRDGARSSGENDDCYHQWQPPEHGLILKLVAQIEYYFSDENLEKDAFLLKHVRRNKMGYVSVKLLTSFKKVKHLTRDWRTTAYALKFSDLLELNEDSRKVRRNTPVPLFTSENLPTRMLLVYDISLAADLPLAQDGVGRANSGAGCAQEQLMERLLKAFVRFGPISSVRVLKPGRDLPPEIKRLSGRYTQVGTQECAVVEFEEVEAAIRAHESMGMADPEPAMKVVLMGTKPPKKKVPRDRSRGGGEPRKIRSANKRVEELQFAGDESSANSSSEPESDPASPVAGRRGGATSSHRLSPAAYPGHHLSPSLSPRSSPWSSPASLRRAARLSPLAGDGRPNLGASPETARRCPDDSSDSSATPSTSPWVQRRRQAQVRERSPVGSPGQSPGPPGAGGPLPVGVVRLPRGPDGTRGFHQARERSDAPRE